MSCFHKACQFKYTFRDYQQKALEEVKKHLEDDKLNIVAAPGAGKTILALQLMVLLGKPTLVCVPSIALREQWIQRFKGDFSHVDEVGVSDDLKDPKTVTVCTYQSLHSALGVKQGSEKVNCVLKAFKDKGFQTIILDEAHHLKKAWWTSLEYFLKEMKQSKTISLTATPPYDVASSEWHNYLSLCGTIDVEIPIPELVKQGDLSPHQDYIFLNYPSEAEVEEIEAQREKLMKICFEIIHNPLFVTAIALHPGIINLDEKADFFTAHFEYYVSMLSFLNFKHIDLNGLKQGLYFNHIPEFNLEQLTCLLDYALFLDAKSYKPFKNLFEEIRKSLNQLGVIEEGHVNLNYGKGIKKLISENQGKLDSINQIIQHEGSLLKEKLKLVVIVDRIREDVYDVESFTEIKMLGALPIFENLRRTLKKDIEAIVLTGKIVIIPTALKQDLLTLCQRENVESSHIVFKELVYDFDYLEVTFEKTASRSMVHLITLLFKESQVEVLIGTSALIGEGWDAPFINTLILASFAGSFVLSNQMRGRAIRIDPSNREKRANIWHLACLEKGYQADTYELGHDFNILKRRFKGFDGLFLNEDKIEYDIERLGFPNTLTYLSKEAVGSMNEIMMKKAELRDELGGRWQKALEDYIPIRRYKMSIDSCTFKEKRLGFKKKISKKSGRGPIYYMINRYHHWQERRSVKAMSKLVRALVESLYKLGVFLKPYEFSMVMEKNHVLFYLNEGDVKENSIFRTCMGELMEPVGNHRYLIKIKDRYFNVPEIMGKRKKEALIFQKQIETHLSFKTQLLYTRFPENKKKVLQIKLNGV